jgi:AraC-like DNA-binding protein
MGVVLGSASAACTRRPSCTRGADAWGSLECGASPSRPPCKGRGRRFVTPQTPSPPRPAIHVGRFEPQGSPADRFEQWLACHPSHELTFPEGARVDDFATTCSIWNLGSTAMTAGHYSPMIATRPLRAIRADQFDHYSVRVNFGQPRHAKVDIDGRRFVAQAGEAVVTDLARPATYHSPGGHVMVLFVARDALDALLPRPMGLHGVVPRGPCAQLLNDHLIGLSKLHEALTPDEGRALSMATVGLLAASLAATPAALEQASPAIDASLRRRMLRYIDAHLDSALLSADALCKAFAVSRTTLYRLFEPLGGVAQEIKTRRLERVHQALLAPQTATRRIAGIAEAFGFADPTYFSRAFRQHFGYTPSQARSMRPRDAVSGLRPGGSYDHDLWLRALRS